MLNLEDIKIINGIFGKFEELKIDLTDVESKEIEKISLLVKQIFIQEKAQEEIAKIQDEIVKLK